jgi:hypothetical protein
MGRTTSTQMTRSESEQFIDAFIFFSLVPCA